MRPDAAGNAVAEGESPRQALSMLQPEKPFRVEERGGQTYIDPRSFQRYDTAARVFASIDPSAAATAWSIVSPVVERAYSEIGRPDTRFESVLARAFERLLSVPVIDRPVEVTPKGIGWEFADQSLEERPPAEKHLLRMGPDNQRLVQSKLRELAGALHLRTVQ